MNAFRLLLLVQMNIFLSFVAKGLKGKRGLSFQRQGFRYGFRSAASAPSAEVIC